jgi:hypothetical protein
MEWFDRKHTGSALSVTLPALLDLARNPITLAIG